MAPSTVAARISELRTLPKYALGWKRFSVVISGVLCLAAVLWAYDTYENEESSHLKDSASEGFAALTAQINLLANKKAQNEKEVTQEKAKVASLQTQINTQSALADAIKNHDNAKIEKFTKTLGGTTVSNEDLAKAQNDLTTTQNETQILADKLKQAQLQAEPLVPAVELANPAVQPGVLKFAFFVASIILAFSGIVFCLTLYIYIFSTDADRRTRAGGIAKYALHYIFLSGVGVMGYL